MSEDIPHLKSTSNSSLMHMQKLFSRRGHNLLLLEEEVLTQLQLILVTASYGENNLVTGYIHQNKLRVTAAV